MQGWQSLRQPRPERRSKRGIGRLNRRGVGAGLPTPVTVHPCHSPPLVRSDPFFMWMPLRESLLKHSPSPSSRERGGPRGRRSPWPQIRTQADTGGHRLPPFLPTPDVSPPHSGGLHDSMTQAVLPKGPELLAIRLSPGRDAVPARSQSVCQESTRSCPAGLPEPHAFSSLPTALQQPCPPRSGVTDCSPSPLTSSVFPGPCGSFGEQDV